MDFMLTSYDRHRLRIKKWPNKKIPIFIFWWLTHNAIAHFLIAFLPFKLFFNFHDFTSKKIVYKKKM